MKRIHYVNLGYPKCGTTWLFDSLSRYPGIDYRGRKEYHYLEDIGEPFNKYVDYYKPYEVSMGFSPSYIYLDSKQFIDLNTCTTHFSIILRNPYEIANSLFNFSPTIKNADSYVRDLIKINFFNFPQVISRVQRNITKPILVLYYENIVSNPANVINQVVDYLGLDYSAEYFLTFANKKINTTTYTRNLTFSDSEKVVLNEWIDQTSDYLHTDLSGWKR